MLPVRTRSIFRSRWAALLWAAGIVWFAVEVAGTPDSSKDETSDAAATPEDSNAALERTERLVRQFER